jgi:hypothetical protein
MCVCVFVVVIVLMFVLVLRFEWALRIVVRGTDIDARDADGRTADDIAQEGNCDLGTWVSYFSLQQQLQAQANPRRVCMCLRVHERRGLVLTRAQCDR